MTEQELRVLLGLDKNERVRRWSVLSDIEKWNVARILRENGYDKAADAIADFGFSPEQFSFPGGYVILSDDDAEEMDGYLGLLDVE